MERIFGITNLVEFYQRLKAGFVVKPSILLTMAVFEIEFITLIVVGKSRASAMRRIGKNAVSLANA